LPIPEIKPTLKAIRSARECGFQLNVGANQLEALGDDTEFDRAAVARMRELCDQLMKAADEAEARRAAK
jgi:hypothetical protein